MNFPRFQTVPTKRARGSAAVSAKKYTKQLCAFDGRSSRSSSVWSETNPLILPKARNKEKANHQRIQTVAAPMVAASDYAFRCLCRQHGVDLCFTQMIHAKNLVDSKVFRRNHLDLYEFQNDNGDREHRPLLLSQLNCLKGCSPASTSLLRIPQPQQQHQQQQETPDLISYENSRTGPLIVQLAGCNVNTVVKAAHLIVEETNGLVDGIDLNLGCPQGIARKGNYGAFLMEQDTELVYTILRALRQSLPSTVAVSAKIRLPPALHSDLMTMEPDSDSGIDINTLRTRIRRLLDTGIDFLTIHGRTLHENKTLVRACHVDAIALAIQEAQSHRPGFPVIANGGVESYGDIPRIQRTTGAAAIMSSEALLERPNVFAVDSSNVTPRRLLHQQFGFCRDYISWCQQYPPLPGSLGHVGGSFNVVRGHLFKFLHRYLQEHVDLRDRLASAQQTTSLCHAQVLIHELYHRYEPLSDNDLAALQSADVASSSWYRRHWGARDENQEYQLGTGATGNPLSQLALEERKVVLKERIAYLQSKRLEKKEVKVSI